MLFCNHSYYCRRNSGCFLSDRTSFAYGQAVVFSAAAWKVSGGFLFSGLHWHTYIFNIHFLVRPETPELMAALVADSRVANLNDRCCHQKPPSKRTHSNGEKLLAKEQDNPALPKSKEGETLDKLITLCQYSPQKAVTR